MIYAGVARDLVDPGLECDLLVCGAQAMESSDKDLLHDVLREAPVVDHPTHVGGDSIAVTAEESLERLVAAFSSGCDEPLVRRDGHTCRHRQWLQAANPSIR